MKHRLLGGVSWLPFFAPDEPAAGGGAPAAEAPASPAVAAAPAGGAQTPPAASVPAAAPAAAAVPALEAPGNILAEAKTPAELAGLANETPEARTARLEREEKIKNETPEQKAEREKGEKEAGDKATQETEKLRVETARKALDDGLKIPEGVDAAQPAVLEFKDKCAALDIPVEKAQQLMDSISPKMATALQAPYQEWFNTQKTWIDACRKDPELGGDGYEKNVAFAALALDSPLCEGPEMRKMLAFTGAGNNPEMFRFMTRLGKMLAEGGPTPNRPAGAEKSLAQEMYPTMKPRDAAA